MRCSPLKLVVACVPSLLVAAALQETEPQMPPPPPQEDHVYALMTTSMGEIVLELDRQKAPVTVANFLSYTDKEFYDGTIFHRVIKDFMIQGGGFGPGMVRKPADKPITNEWRNGLKNLRGTIAMARLGGQPDSASSQFFINVKDNSGLDRPQPDGAGYAVFGKVVAGMKVADAIRNVPTGAVTDTTGQGHKDVPLEDVVIQKVRRIDQADAKKRIDAEKAAAPRAPGP